MSFCIPFEVIFTVLVSGKKITPSAEGNLRVREFSEPIVNRHGARDAFMQRPTMRLSVCPRFSGQLMMMMMMMMM
jgi:hypothetical protein